MLRAAPDGSPLRLALRAHLRDDQSVRLISHSRTVNALPGPRPAITTRTGLTVQAALDTDPYPKAIKITDAQMKTLSITRLDFHCD